MQSLKILGHRKVTLTEIEEGVEWNWPDPGNIEEEEVVVGLVEAATPSTDEIFESLDGIVQVRRWGGRKVEITELFSPSKWALSNDDNIN